LSPLVGSDRANLAVRRANQGAFNDAGDTFFIEERNQALTDCELSNNRFDIQLRWYERSELPRVPLSDHRVKA
jgi:hypothetical protein